MSPTITVSATEPDISREQVGAEWNPGRRLLRTVRRFQIWQKRGGLLGRLVCSWFILEHRFWSTVASADIPLNCYQIGEGLLLPHPVGVVIHPDAELGPNCMLLQGVTLVGGVRLGGHVDVGAGAKIIRPVTVGDHARIGANAVVLEDVPAQATVVGIPARQVGAPKPSNGTP